MEMEASLPPRRTPTRSMRHQTSTPSPHSPVSETGTSPLRTRTPSLRAPTSPPPNTETVTLTDSAASRPPNPSPLHRPSPAVRDKPSPPRRKGSPYHGRSGTNWCSWYCSTNGSLRSTCRRGSSTWQLSSSSSSSSTSCSSGTASRAPQGGPRTRTCPRTHPGPWGDRSSILLSPTTRTPSHRPPSTTCFRAAFLRSRARLSRSATPPVRQQAQPTASRPVKTIQPKPKKRAGEDHSAQLAQGSNPGTGKRAVTAGQKILQDVFGDKSGGAEVPAAQTQAQVETTPKKPKAISTGEGKKRAREDEDGGENEERATKRVATATPTKAGPKVRLVKHDLQVSPESNGGVGAEPAPQQDAEDTSRLRTPEQNNTRTGASEPAGAPPQDTSTSTMLTPELQLEDLLHPEIFE